MTTTLPLVAEHVYTSVQLGNAAFAQANRVPGERTVIKRLIVVVGLIVVSCGGDKIEQACLDVADAFGDLCVRCNVDDYQVCYDAILQGVNGDCDNVAGIRDEDELYSQCLPWFMNVSCAQVTAPGFMLDSSCVGQLQIFE